MSGDSLGDRIKRYERCADAVLTWRTPVILRVDGRAFHTWTRGLDKPFDEGLMRAMDQTAIAMCKEIAGAAVAFVQSDEVSVLIHTYRRFSTEPWLDNRVQKLCSLGASIATAAFNRGAVSLDRPPALFDARCFTLPPAEVTNYFLWRQQDTTRNSIQMLARSLASHRECEGLNTKQLQELSWQRGSNWNDLPVRQKRGRAVVRELYEEQGEDGPVTRSRWVVDDATPIFKNEDRDYIEQHLATEES